MATEKQIAANRSNALSSTGPRSLAGKARSSQNAVRHGLTAQHAMLPGEDPQEYAELRGAMFSSLLPQGVLENQLVEQVASLVWRLRRFPAFETSLFEWTAHYMAQCYDAPANTGTVERRNDPFGDEDGARADLHDPLRLGRVMDALLTSDTASKLTRYETSLRRHLDMTLKQLREMQQQRREREEAAEKERAKEKARSRLVDPEDDPAYWAGIDRQRIKRMDPP